MGRTWRLVYCRGSKNINNLPEFYGSLVHRFRLDSTQLLYLCSPSSSIVKVLPNLFIKERQWTRLSLNLREYKRNWFNLCPLLLANQQFDEISFWRTHFRQTCSSSLLPHTSCEGGFFVGCENIMWNSYVHRLFLRRSIAAKLLASHHYFD